MCLLVGYNIRQLNFYKHRGNCQKHCIFCTDMKNHIKKRYEVVHGSANDTVGIDLPIKISIALYSRWGPWASFENRNKESLSLNMVTMGNAKYYQEGRTGIVESGQIFLAHKGAAQKFETGAAGFLHKRTIILSGWAVELLINHTGLREVDVVIPRRSSVAIQYMREAYRLLGEKPPGYVIRLSHLAYEFLLDCAASLTIEYPPQLQRAVEYTGKKLSENMSLAQIAQIAGVSIRQCNRLFKEHLKCSPLQFVNQQRMKIAREMLLNTSSSIKSIALKSGFEDPLYFSSQFRKFYGMSPKHIRKQKIEE